MYKHFQYRIYPTLSQRKRLENTLETCRRFYNKCLAERKDAYEQRRETINKYAQLHRVKEEKANSLFATNIHSHVLQIVVTDLDGAFQAFFRRVKTGQKPGYPRFKGSNRFDSFGYKEYGNGFKLDGRRLRLFKIGRVAVRWHRPIEGKIKTLRIRRKAGVWYACFSCEVEPKPLPKTGKVVGIDVGVTHLLATSDKELVENPKWYRAKQSKLRVLQRRVARREKGGNNRCKSILALQRSYEHISNQRKDYLNKIVAYLIGEYDLIAVEDLRINNMVKNHSLAKSILDGGWGYLTQQLAHKAVEADRELVRVAPAYTSKTCSACGAVFENLRLSDRWVTCGCGLSLDRDINAAINIRNRALINRDGQSRWELTWAAAPCVSQEAAIL